MLDSKETLLPLLVPKSILLYQFFPSLADLGAKYSSVSALKNKSRNCLQTIRKIKAIWFFLKKNHHSNIKEFPFTLAQFHWSVWNLAEFMCKEKIIVAVNNIDLSRVRWWGDERSSSFRYGFFFILRFFSLPFAVHCAQSGPVSWVSPHLNGSCAFQAILCHTAEAWGTTPWLRIMLLSLLIRLQANKICFIAAASLSL